MIVIFFSSQKSVKLKSQLKTTKKNVYTNVVNNTKKSSKTGMFISDYGGSDTATTGTAAATATTNMTEDFEKASQFSTKSFICCDAYQAEFHVSKDGFSVVSKETRNKDRSFSRNRQHNQSHDKSTRRNNKANLSESGQHNTKADTPKSNEFNLDSNNNNINTNNNNNNNNNNAQTSKQSGYPPTPPPLPHTGLYVNAPSYIPINYNSNKLPIPPPPPPPPNLVHPSSLSSLATTTKTTKSTSKSKKKSDLMSNTPTLEELSSHSSRNAQHFINQSKFTSITTDDNQSNDIPVGYLTPSNTPKHCDFNRKVTSSSINRQHSATSNQIIEELKTRYNYNNDYINTLNKINIYL